MWIKYWTVGNGGMSGEVNIAEIRDDMDNDEIENYIEAQAGPMPSGYRGSQYKKLKMSEIPPTMLYEEIDSRKGALENAKRRVKKVPELEQAIKESKERLDEIKTWTLRKLLKQKENHCSEREDHVAEMLAVKSEKGYWHKPSIHMYVRDKMVKVSGWHRGDSFEKEFKISAKVADVVDWIYFNTSMGESE